MAAQAVIRVHWWRASGASLTWEAIAERSWYGETRIVVAHAAGLSERQALERIAERLDAPTARGQWSEFRARALHGFKVELRYGSNWPAWALFSDGIQRTSGADALPSACLTAFIHAHCAEA